MNNFPDTIVKNRHLRGSQGSFTAKDARKSEVSPQKYVGGFPGNRFEILDQVSLVEIVTEEDKIMIVNFVAGTYGIPYIVDSHNSHEHFGCGTNADPEPSLECTLTPGKQGN